MYTNSAESPQALLLHAASLQHGSRTTKMMHDAGTPAGRHGHPGPGGCVVSSSPGVPCPSARSRASGPEERRALQRPDNVAANIALRTRTEQGLPEVIEDPATVERIAALIDPPDDQVG